MGIPQPVQPLSGRPPSGRASSGHGEPRANTMTHSDSSIARRPSFSCSLALLACAAIGCGRSADLFPDDGQSNLGCAVARGCDPGPEPAPCTRADCDGTTAPDIGTDSRSDDEPRGEPDPERTDPEIAQPSSGLPHEPAEPELEPTPAGPQSPEPSERPPEAPREPLPEPAVPDAGIASATDAGIAPPSRGPGGPRPDPPPRPARP